MIYKTIWIYKWNLMQSVNHNDLKNHANWISIKNLQTSTFFSFWGYQLFCHSQSSSHMLLHLSNITIQDDGVLFMKTQQQLQDFHSFLKRNFPVFFLCWLTLYVVRVYIVLVKKCFVLFCIWDVLFVVRTSSINVI